MCVVGGVFGFVILALWLRLFQVQYLRHDEYAAAADRQHVAPRELQAARGGIFDRNGRPLAMNIRRCSVAVQPRRVKDSGEIVRVLGREAGVPAKVVRAALRGPHPFVYVKHDCMLDDDTRREISRIDGIVVEANANRIYPYDAVGSKVVGFVSRDNRGLAGIEMAYDGALRGTAGRVTVLRNGRYSSDRYYEYVDRKPLDGKHVYLTIDATVQDIAETELRQAVAEFGARGGAVIVTDVATGDVLALAECPAVPTREISSRADSLWTLRSVSHVYEPGSTFKLVTVAALLDKTHIAPADSFDAEDGRADLGFAVINDPHPHDMLTVEEAFMYSSNIVMAKASGYLQNGDLYGYAKLFGFGAKTGVGLPGESAGSVPPIKRWSARTRATMAFGQEVAVTPLQLLNAYAAIANDGVMMMPRLVKAVADPRTGEVLESEPVMMRRVVSPETAGTLREFCLQVVEKGTAQAAKVSFMQVAGKTGTAQKAGRRGYLANKYISSFVGFAPYDHPRIACLVIIDEPRWSSRFGGDSAAPVFARVCESMASSTPIFDDVLSVEMVRADVAGGRRSVTPNFLRMERGAALDFATRAGANVLCDGEDGRVVAQTPPPGTVMDRDQVVRLVCAGAKFATGRLDVEGHQRVREAYRVAPSDPQDGPVDDDAVRLGMNVPRSGQALSLVGYSGAARR
ncbi:MAG TPA: penicillin-binding transpeptidase domain-containing protein [Candidatus Krumholzibacteria bacterium]